MTKDEIQPAGVHDLARRFAAGEFRSDKTEQERLERLVDAIDAGFYIRETAPDFTPMAPIDLDPEPEPPKTETPPSLMTEWWSRHKGR